MRDLEASLQHFGEFILKAKLVKDKAAPYCVRWVRRFLMRPASDEPVADQVRRFCEELERDAACQDWQVRQAEHALRIYFVNFLQRMDWQRRPLNRVVRAAGTATSARRFRIGSLQLMRVTKQLMGDRGVMEEVNERLAKTDDDDPDIDIEATIGRTSPA